jgi:hypothetical protein
VVVMTAGGERLAVWRKGGAGRVPLMRQTWAAEPGQGCRRVVLRFAQGFEDVEPPGARVAQRVDIAAGWSLAAVVADAETIARALADPEGVAASRGARRSVSGRWPRGRGRIEGVRPLVPPPLPNCITIRSAVISQV